MFFSTHFETALKELEKIIKEAMNERQANPAKSNQKSLIDVLLANSDTYSESKLISEALSVMIEGFHTSGYRKYKSKSVVDVAKTLGFNKKPFCLCGKRQWKV